MSSLRDRSNRLRPKSRGKYISLAGILGLLVCPLVAPTAQATGASPTVGMYLDLPFVQGSYVAEQFPTETSVTTFDDQTAGYPGETCSFTGATVDTAIYPARDCHVYPHTIFGGASTASSTPTVGQAQSLTNYAGVGGGGISIVFDTPQTYFGMWWSAGSVGNQVQLMSGSDVVASTSADDVQTSIFQSSYLNAQNGDYYASKFYLANPYGWTTVGTPTNFTDLDADNTYQNTGNVDPYEAFVFIHFIAAPGTTFDRVNMIAPGNGFEFDNFTTSISTDIASSIPSHLVLQRQLYAPNYVDFNANGGTGSMTRQYSVDNAAAYLNYNCMDGNDPTRCISAPNNAYNTQALGWNTEPDGSGTSYYYEDWQPFPFTESTTLYAQWQTNFQYSYLTYAGTNFSEDVTGETVWNYVDENSYSSDSARNFADTTLPSPTREGQYLEGWYTFDTTNYTIVRAGDPGQVVPASTYTHWDTNLFGHWVDNPTSAIDAATPEALLVYPRETSVSLPNLPLTGDVTASICLVESDSSGNQVSSDLQFTDLATATSGFTSSYTISSSTALVTNTSRYVRVTVSTSADTSCSTGTTHIIEIRPVAAEITNVLPLYLTER